MKEEWKPVVGYEELYEVSSNGRVRSHQSHGTGKRGGLLAQASTPKGYRVLTLCKEKRKRQWRVHQLVVLAFLGKIGAGKQVHHINADTSDNRVENLEIVSAKNNLGARRMPCGSRHRGAKLSERAVLEIRHRLKRGAIGAVLAREFCVLPCTISAIKVRRIWAHI